jgi:cytochrome c5
MGGRVVDFTNPEYWKSSSDGMVTQAILKGKGRMPAQSVSPEEARAIVDYMKSAFKGRYGS